MIFAQIILPIKLDWLPHYSLPYEVCNGTLVEVNLAGRLYVGVVHSTCPNPPQGLPQEKISPVVRILEDAPIVTPGQIRFWEEMAEYYLCTLGEVYKAVPMALEPPKRKLKKNISTPRSEEIRLSPAQQQVENGIWEALSNKQSCLLEGVTGSGKTEIYLSIAKKIIEKGQSVLYMVPEIALSRQLEERLYNYFGDKLYCFHSKETPARRKNLVWRLSQEKEPTIVLGTRSALFLPPENFGLIIVDEEHDHSYKQESPAPRYHGRDGALMLSQILKNCPVLLGSGTPSLESLYNCEKGKMQHFILREKYHKAEPADILFIHTGQEAKKRGMRGSFSIKLIERIHECLQEKRQVMLLRSRKSYALYIQCEDCGFVPKCSSCNLPLSYNKAADKWVCYHCGQHKKHRNDCPHCGGKLKAMGGGTQKIEEEARLLFPDARILRLDGDISHVQEEREIIEKFSQGEADILVGTQMVSKGFDFPLLKLVAVIDADSLLNLQDFRADEKALQTFEQLRGRCSRREEKGLFIIQSRQENHPVFDCLTKGIDWQLTERQQERKDFSYPPYTRLIDIHLHDVQLERLNEKSKKLAQILQLNAFRITGPYMYGSGKSKGYYTNCIRVDFPKNKEYKERKKQLSALLKAFCKQEKYISQIYVNVDPL